MDAKPFLLFDFDGVLVDTANLSFQVLPEYFPGITNDEMLSMYDGNGVATVRTFAARHNIADIDACVRSLGLRFTELTKATVLSDEVCALVRDLAERYEMFIVSTAREEGIDAILRRSNMQRHFTKVYGQLAHPSKVEKIKMIFAEHGAAPDRCLFVTDTLGDVKEAREAGVDAVAVTWGFHDRVRLAKGSPWAIVDKLEDIPTSVHNYFSR